MGFCPTQPSYCSTEQKLLKSLESLHCSINTLSLHIREQNSEHLNDLPNFTQLVLESEFRHTRWSDAEDHTLSATPCYLPDVYKGKNVNTKR